MLNKVILQGRFTRDPELRSPPSGTQVASFSLASDNDQKSDSGEKTTTFIDCVAWRNNAEFVTKNFHKGDMVVVVGSLRIRSWQDRDGNKRKSAEISVDSAYFCGRGSAYTAAGTQYGAAGYAAAASAPASDGAYELLDSDEPLPF